MDALVDNLTKWGTNLEELTHEFLERIESTSSEDLSLSDMMKLYDSEISNQDTSDEIESDLQSYLETALDEWSESLIQDDIPDEDQNVHDYLKYLADNPDEDLLDISRYYSQMIQ